MQYLKAKTGKVVHHASNPDYVGDVGVCPCGKGNMIPKISQGEAEEIVFKRNGKFCQATMEVKMDKQREEFKGAKLAMDPHQPDWEGEGDDGAGWQAEHKLSDDGIVATSGPYAGMVGDKAEMDRIANEGHEVWKPQAKQPSIRDALLDQYHARMEIRAKRKANRQRLKDQEQARKLGLEPGDRVVGVVPDRVARRQRVDVGTNAIRNGRIMRRVASRKKTPASIWTHRAHIDADGLMYRFRIGDPEFVSAKLARKRDRDTFAATIGR